MSFKKITSFLFKKLLRTNSTGLTAFYHERNDHYFVSPSKRQELRFEQTLEDHKYFFRGLNKVFTNEDGNIILDIGSNLGYWALAFDQYLDRDKIIFAFEPDTENFQYLSHNTSRFPNIQLFQTGLSSQIEDLSVAMPDYVQTLSEDRKGNTGYLSVLHNSHNSSEIRFSKGDSFISGFLKESDKVFLIKIDVEGFEDKVLQGLNKTLSTHKPAVILEINPRTQILSGYNLHHVLTPFYELDYLPLVPITDIAFKIDDKGMPNQALNMILAPMELVNKFKEEMSYVEIH